MLRGIRSKILYIRIGLAHAAYHRNLRKADAARLDSNLIKFKKYIYRAESAWKRVVILTEKQKLLNGKESSL